MIVRRFAVVMMSVSMVVVAMGRRRHTQTHLFRPIFPVQPRALRTILWSPDRPVGRRPDQVTLAIFNQC